MPVNKTGIPVVHGGEDVKTKGVHWVAGQWAKHQEATC